MRLSPADFSRRARALSLLTLLLAAPWAGCGGGKQDGAGPGVSPVKIFGLEDKPIIITGSSVDIDFDHAHYEQSPRNDDQFISEDSKITAMAVFNDDYNANDGDYFTYQIPAGGITVITITTRHGGETQTIDVRDTPARDVVITFDTSAFRPRGNLANSRKHFNRKFKVESISVTNDGRPVPCHKNGQPYDCRLPAGKFTLQIGARP